MSLAPRRRTVMLYPLCAAWWLISIPASVGAQGDPRNADEEIRQVARRYFDARIANDTTVVRGLLAVDYIGINSSGVMGDRASALRLPMNVTPMGQRIVAFEHDSLHVRVYGTTAIMTGIRIPHGPGGPMGGGVRFMLVFVQRDGRWQIVASQSTDRARGTSSYSRDGQMPLQYPQVAPIALLQHIRMA